MAPDIETLIQAMTSPGQAPGGGDPVQDMLAQLADTDPRARLLATLLARRRSPEPEPQPAAGPALPTPDEARRAGRAGERRAAFRRLQQLIHSMYDELAELRARNEMLVDLARALGMCPLCLGRHDPHCPACAGRGDRSGFFVPDRTLFTRYVVPAVRRLRAQGAPRRPHAAGGPTPRQTGRDESTTMAPDTRTEP